MRRQWTCVDGDAQCSSSGGSTALLVEIAVLALDCAYPSWIVVEGGGD